MSLVVSIHLESVNTNAYDFSLCQVSLAYFRFVNTRMCPKENKFNGLLKNYWLLASWSFS